ncbi:MAG: hypothetical protein V3V29_04530 [Acidimicrobiia bacterium]
MKTVALAAQMFHGSIAISGESSLDRQSKAAPYVADHVFDVGEFLAGTIRADDETGTHRVPPLCFLYEVDRGTDALLGQQTGGKWNRQTT